MKLAACMAILIALLSTTGFSQSPPPKITGVVHSLNDSSVLNSVSVMVKGTSRGTTTNTAGTYTIAAGSNDVLVFSLLGHVTQEVPVNGQASIDIYMKPGGDQLSEVVVTTALGIKKQQKSLGYAVQEVSGETMAKTKAPTAIGGLTGKVAGLNIKNTTDLFQNPSISLRGVTPLIVIDGIPDPNADPYKLN